MFCHTFDKKRIYYEIRGNHSVGKTLIFLNGLTQSTLSWELIIPYFEKDYRILLMDFVFQGRSDKTGEWRDFDQHASDVKALLDQLGVKRLSMVSISYGSLVAQNFALLFPETLEKLVLLSTFCYKTPYYNAIEKGWWEALEKGGYDLLLDVMLPEVLSEGYFANPVIPLEAMKKARKAVNTSSDALFKLMRATKERKDFRKQLNRITVPTLLLQGEKDRLFPVHQAEECHRNIRNSKLVVIKNAGHTLNLEALPEVTKRIGDFLAGS
jgi:3-oxoadipate enol-lactonase